MFVQLCRVDVMRLQIVRGPLETPVLRLEIGVFGDQRQALDFQIVLHPSKADRGYATAREEITLPAARPIRPPTSSTK